MGSLLGISSLTSFFSLDADKHVCIYRCDTHDCYTGKGDEPGCQLFLHPYAIESQQDCVLCMQCHKNCPYGSVKLNLQFPGTAIVAVASPSLAVALTSTALVGILPVERGGLLAPGNDFFNELVNGLGIEAIPLYTVIFLCAAALPSLILLLMERFLGGHDFKKSLYRLSRFGYSLLPFALLGHIAFYGKKTIAWLEAIISRTGVSQIDFFSANLVFYGIYSIIILLGVAGTIHTFIRIHRSDPQTLNTGRKLMVGYTALIGFYTILYLLAVL
jgi:ferredoxin